METVRSKALRDAIAVTRDCGITKRTKHCSSRQWKQQPAPIQRGGAQRVRTLNSNLPSALQQPHASIGISKLRSAEPRCGTGIPCWHRWQGYGAMAKGDINAAHR